MVIAPSPVIQERVRWENDFVSILDSAGYKAVKSLDLIPYSLDTPSVPTKEEVNMKGAKAGCDGVLFLTILRKDGTLTINKGSSIKANQQIIAGLLTGLLKSNNSVEPVAGIETPASFSRGGNYFTMQSILYDLATETILHNSTSPDFEITSLEKVRRQYLTDLISQLEKEHLLTK